MIAKPGASFLSAGVTRRALLLGASASLGACNFAESELARGRQTTTLWFSYGGKNRETLEALVALFNRSQREVFVRAVFQGDYYECLAKLRLALAAKAPPALSHVVGEVVPYLAEAGVLEPLARYASEESLDLVPALAQSGSWLGGARHALVALPFNRSTPIAYLNAELFAEARLRAPETWDELRAVAARLSERRAGQAARYGFGCPIDWWFWAALVGQAGGSIADERSNITLGGEACVAALEFWQTLVLRDQSMKPPPGRDYNAWEQTNQDFLAGRVAMIWSSTAFLEYLEKTASFPLIAAPLPRRERRAVPTGGTHWVMLAGAPAAEKLAAFRFLEFMLAEDQAIAWATRTGYIPVTRAAIRTLDASGHYRRHPNQRVALDQLDAAMPWPWSKQLFRVEREILQPRLEQAVFAEGGARALLEEARRLVGKA